MKKPIFFSLFASVLACAANTEEILTEPLTLSNVAFTQDRMTQKVTVTYDLSNGGDSALVFMDVMTNGVSIGRENVKTLSGAVSAGIDDPVAEGKSKQIVWDARKDWSGNLVTNAAVVLTAFYKDKLYNIPGIYMVVDISGGTSAESFPVSYSLEGPDLSNDACRSSQLWLRRIEPCTFMMGSPATEANRNASYEKLHEVTLTKPYFAAVFEMTEAQHYNLTGTANSTKYSAVGAVSWNTIRGADTVWPLPDEVPETSVAGILRKKTGIGGFDLPTDAQWECACRAGTTTAWNNGTTNTVDTASDPELLKLGWHAQDKKTVAMKAGLKEANGWGLYDMHGNVMEWVLDFSCADNSADTLDPKGYSSAVAGSTKHIARSGSYLANRATTSCRSAARDTSYAPTIQYQNLGYRIFCNFGDPLGK